MFEIFFHKYYQLLLIFFGAIFFYEALMNVFHYLYHKQKEAFNHVFMCLSCFSYCLLCFFAVSNEFNLSSGIFIIISAMTGAFACYFYFGAIKSFLKINSKLISIIQYICLFVAIVSIVDLISTLNDWPIFFFIENGSEPVSILGKHLNSKWFLSPVALTAIGLGQVVTFAAYIQIWKFLKINNLREPLLYIGMIVSFLATVNDVLGGTGFTYYSLPVIFLGFFLEMVRFSSFYSKAASKQVATLQLNLSESQRIAQVGMMSASIAHDIRNPLSLILMSTRIIQKLIKNQASNDNFIKIESRTDKIIQAGNQIESVIKTYLVMMRKQENDPKEDILLYDLLAKCEILLSPRLSEFGIDFKYNIKKDTVLHCRESDYLLVFSNLISNSIDAVKNQENRWIEISILPTDGTNKIVISDSGPEISNEIREKMFLSQFTTKDKQEGTGLGLGIIASLLGAHGHKIYLNKKNKNTQLIIET
jgi:signal transduction histidine kinase